MAESKTKKAPMRDVYIEKVTVNVCVGNDKQGMDKAKKLLEKITEKTPVRCSAKRRLATWQIRPGLPIGYKVTLRGDDATKFLKWIIDSKGKQVSSKSFDTNGNFAIGFHEYLDLNGIKYDADIGIMGFEVMVTFARPGFRIRNRLLNNKKIPKRHKVTPEESTMYLKEHFKAEVI